MILLAFLAIAVVGAVSLLVAGRIGPGRWRRAPGPELENREGEQRFPAAAGLAEPDPRLPPVLLPERPVAADIADLRFSVGFRGYRMDEVDVVLERLATALLERDAALAELRGPGGPGPAAPPGIARTEQPE